VGYRTCKCCAVGRLLTARAKVALFERALETHFFGGLRLVWLLWPGLEVWPGPWRNLVVELLVLPGSLVGFVSHVLKFFLLHQALRACS
jgi:hypothetical protein